MILLLLLCIASVSTAIGGGIKGHPDYEWMKRSLQEECGKLVNGHLPPQVEPQHYKMTIKFDHLNSTFSGYIIISVKIVNETRKITINAKDLKIEEVCFVQDDRYYVPYLRYCKREETITFTFDKNLTVGIGDLKLLFKGQLNENFFGLYKGKCKRCKKTEFLTAISQFAFINARRAFPCFDEPSYRTTFQVKLIAVRNSTILSNMPEASDLPYGENELNMHKVIFSTTPKMSTYLLAFVIGNYDFIESKSKDGHVLVRVYTPKGKREEGKYALQVAVNVLEFFQKYFEIIFPLPKLDIIANPTLPVKSAENWGLIIFREASLLIDRNTSSIDLQMDISKNVAYEIARQWIGNLVSMESWTEIWLQEGLSTFMAYLCNDALHPQWHVWHRFIAEEFSIALRIDSLNSSYPLELRSSEFQTAFEEIVFKKGAAILRMLHEWIGAEDFRKGINIFLRGHKYDNANTTDFLLAMKEASKQPVDEVMKSWITQRGYPVIKVETCDTCKDFNVTQERFSVGEITVVNESNTLWKVPIIYSTSLELEKGKKFILTDRNKTIKSNISTGFGVILKSGCVGFYRVQYPSNVSKHLFELVRTKKLSAEKRFGLQNDFFALAKVGKESIVDYLRYLENYRNEDELFIWDSIESSLTEISSLLSNTDCQENFYYFIRSLMKDVFNKSGWDRKPNEDITTTILRSLAITTMGLAGDPLIVDESISRFVEHVNHRRQINPNLTSIVFNIVAAHGNETIFNHLFGLYNSTTIAHQKHSISVSMGRTKDESLIRRLLLFSLSKDLTFDETANIIVSVTSSLKGRRLAWDFFVENEAEILKRNKGSVNLGFLIRGILSTFASRKKADEFEDFFKKHNFAGMEIEVRESLDIIRENADWFDRDGSNLCKFLKQNDFN